MAPPGLVILGFGGHARSVADIALDLGIPALVFVDANAKDGEEFRGHPAVTALPADAPQGWPVFLAAGDNAERRRQWDRAVESGRSVYRLISKRAYVGQGAVIGDATLVAHHAHLGPLASIGRGCIINTASVIEHETVIGDFTHISVNATVAGRCRIGDRVLIGAGATVIDRVRIADEVVIGAGATVTADIDRPGVYVGTPARRMSSSDGGKAP